MITINTKKLKELKPCTERFKNWLENYSEFNGTFVEFLNLPEISYNDKIWVSKKILARDILEQWAILCAESVLHIFENRHPNDKRLRECLEYLKSGERDKEKILEHIRNCYAAVYAADAAAADAAVYAAYAAAADTAYAVVVYAAAAAHAAHAANAANDVDDVDDAANAARQKQQSKNLEFLKSLLKEE